MTFAKSPFPFGSEELIARSSHLWMQAEGSEATGLLRVSILRDLYRALHAQKSKCLALGLKEDARALNAWENRLVELRSSAQLQGDVVELLRGTEPVKKRTRLLPESLFAILPREKLDRYDRAWEQTLAAEAFALGWRLWSLQAWVEIPSIESWNSLLSEQLWPNGIVLFVDSVGFIESKSGDPNQALWQGEWFLLLDPRITRATELSIDLSSFPGRPPSSARGAGVSEPAWKQLFTPKKRL